MVYIIISLLRNGCYTREERIASGRQKVAITTVALFGRQIVALIAARSRTVNLERGF